MRRRSGANGKVVVLHFFGEWKINFLELEENGETKTLGGGFKCFFFNPRTGEMFKFDQYFSKGLKPPTRT